jgi:predicted Zn-dependent peptidase
MFNSQLARLQNGLTVVKVPMESVKSITCLAFVGTGSRFEQEHQQGAAHLLEHLVFRGTKQFPDRRQLAIQLDSVGANSNAFTGKEYTGYFVTAASRHLKLGLKVVKDLIFAPLLRPQDLAQEKQVVLEEIKMYQDAPDDCVAQEFEGMTYAKSGLAHPILGSPQTVAAISSQELKQFLNQWYGLGNMVLVLAGDAELLQSSDCDQLIQQTFKQQPEEREDNYQQKRQQFFKDNPFSQQRLRIIKRPTAQTHFVLGWPALKRNDPQRYVLSVLSTVIGGNRSSRLHQTVREDLGLAYYIYSDVDQYHDAGLLGVSAGVNTERIEEALEVTLQEYYQIAAGELPVKKEELSKAKDYLTGTFTLSLENSLSVARYYGLGYLLRDEFDDPAALIEKIQAVTLDQVHALAQKLLKPEQLRLAVIGPFKDQQKFEHFVQKT